MTAPHCNEPLAVLDISSPASRAARLVTAVGPVNGQPCEPKPARASFLRTIPLSAHAACAAGNSRAGLLSFNRREHIQKVRVRGGTTFPSELLETPDLIGLQLRVLRQRLHEAEGVRAPVAGEPRLR